MFDAKLLNARPNNAAPGRRRSRILAKSNVAEPLSGPSIRNGTRFQGRD
jgi:hypothetical protein